MLIVLLARGADSHEVQLSHEELGRLAFQHERVKRGSQALRKRAAEMIEELNEKHLVEVTEVVVGKGRGRSMYRVHMNAEASRENQRVVQEPKTPPRRPKAASGQSSGALKDLLSPKARRSLPPGFKLPREG
ncbi:MULTISPECIES: hypothetical protein [unclassified Deinococcus]|uniref:hypothetical protein n=1 Tax=unclassified Deinococcus TaxID=2623546 RepID=UPI001C2F4A0B|nr:MULTISPECIES: hypothetical protein [unclassified Deinococcus]MDK2010993.1 hypothetical protein [Deinococcus sp. 43]